MLSGAEDWIRAHVVVGGPIEITKERPWATVMRVPIVNGHAWFKACAPVQAFEPRMTATLFARWPDRVAEVLAYDEARAWMLLADAGTALSTIGNRPEEWLAILPSYGELQHGEVAHLADHLAHHVPDLRLSTLPRRYDELLSAELPLAVDEIRELRAFRGHFGDLCQELESVGVSDTVQHDDLHAWNVYRHGERWRVLDWGDASISHPFMSLVVTFRFLEEANALQATDPWFARLRDAYLEPWGPGLRNAFDLAMRIGAFAHPLVELRHRSPLAPSERVRFDESLRIWLQRALLEIGR